MAAFYQGEFEGSAMKVRLSPVSENVASIPTEPGSRRWSQPYSPKQRTVSSRPSWRILPPKRVTRSYLQNTLINMQPGGNPLHRQQVLQRTAFRTPQRVRFLQLIWASLPASAPEFIDIGTSGSGAGNQAPTPRVDPRGDQIPHCPIPRRLFSNTQHTR